MALPCQDPLRLHAHVTGLQLRLCLRPIPSAPVTLERVMGHLATLWLRSFVVTRRGCRTSTTLCGISGESQRSTTACVARWNRCDST